MVKKKIKGITGGRTVLDRRLKEVPKEVIEQRIAEVKASGFGNVMLYIRNGVVYRVAKSTEDYVENKT